MKAKKFMNLSKQKIELSLRLLSKSDSHISCSDIQTHSYWNVCFSCKCVDGKLTLAFIYIFSLLLKPSTTALQRNREQRFELNCIKYFNQYQRIKKNMSHFFAFFTISKTHHKKKMKKKESPTQGKNELFFCIFYY